VIFYLLEITRYFSKWLPLGARNERAKCPQSAEVRFQTEKIVFVPQILTPALRRSRLQKSVLWKNFARKSKYGFCAFV